MRTPIVFLDMDGVLADLESGVATFTGDQRPTANKGKFFGDYLPRYVDNDGFATQPKMKNADELVNELYKMMDDGHINLGILTSAGKFSKISEVVRQKKAWIETNYPQLIDVPFCATTSGADKSFLASKKTLLIDDHYKNITHFINAGGYGVVYHHDSLSTVLSVAKDFAVKEAK